MASMVEAMMMCHSPALLPRRACRLMPIQDRVIAFLARDEQGQRYWFHVNEENHEQGGNGCAGHGEEMSKKKADRPSSVDPDASHSSSGTVMKNCRNRKVP